MFQQTLSGFAEISLPSAITTVILDFDNTCYLYEPCHNAALAKVFTWFENKFGSHPNLQEQYQKAQQIVKARIPDQSASHSRILYFKSLLENLAIEDTVTNSLSMEQLYWDTFKSHMKPVPGLLSFLAVCQERGTKVVVVSDLTTTIQCEKICRLGISSYIDALVTSEEVGVEKPDSRCFMLALEKADAQPVSVVVIGDSYEKDIIGANNLGISSILITHDIQTQKAAIR